MKAGLIGSGVMGVPMAQHILDAGHELFVYNRTKEKARGLITRGAVLCESPGDVAHNAEVIISMVSDPAAVKEVSMGSGGILANMSSGSVHVDMSTVSIKWADSMEKTYTNEGKLFVHSPVLGSKPQAEQGVLLSFAGGSEVALDKATPVLETFSKKIYRLSSAGQSASLKLAANMLIGSLTAGLSQSMVYVKKAGMDPALLLDVLGESALKNPYMMMKAEKIVNRDFSPQFFIDHLSKDLSLALEGGRDLGVSLPVAAAIREIYVASQATGSGQEDIVSIIKVLESLSGLKD